MSFLKAGKIKKKLNNIEKQQLFLKSLDFIFEKWLIFSKNFFSLLIFSNFYLLIYFLFFCFLKIKNLNKNLKIFKLFYNLNDNFYLNFLKSLNKVKLFKNKKFEKLFAFLVYKLNNKWTNIILKKFSKNFFKIILVENTNQLFFLFFKKILTFFFTSNFFSLNSFIVFKINQLFLLVGKSYFFKRLNFIFSSRYFLLTKLNHFFWKVAKKNRFFFFALLMWIYVIFDKISYIYWLAFFFFWLRNFIFLLFGLNWLWINTKNDIFKAFEYSRILNIFFNNNIDFLERNFFVIKIPLFDFFYKVKALSFNCNYVYFNKSVFEDWDVFSSFYFFQDKGSHFFLKMQRDVFSFNVFIDRFFKKNLKKNLKPLSKNPVDSMEHLFLDLQPVTPNIKNFWFLDKSREHLDLMFFCKNIFTKFFYLKKQNTFFSSFFFEQTAFVTQGKSFLSFTAVKPFVNLFFFKKFFRSLRNLFFYKFFLFFFQNFFFFSFYFFHKFFINTFFFKFIKLISFFVLFIFEFFFRKNFTLKNKNFLFYFCLYFRNFLTSQNFFKIDLSFLLDFLKLDFWDVHVPNVPFLLFRDNEVSLKFLKSFSFITKTDDITENLFYSNLLKKFLKKMFFFESFLKKNLYSFFKKNTNFVQDFSFLKQRRFQRFLNFFFFFIKLQEDTVLKKKKQKTLADFTMEDFIGFDLLNLSLFFFNPLKVVPDLRVPLIFWNFFKLKFFSFLNLKSFSFFKNLKKKFLKKFMNFFFFYNLKVVTNYTNFLIKNYHCFFTAIVFLRRLKKQSNFFYQNRSKIFFSHFFNFFFSHYFFKTKAFFFKPFVFKFFSSLFFPAPFFNQIKWKFLHNFTLLSSFLTAPLFFFNPSSFLMDRFYMQQLFFYKFFFEKKSYFPFNYNYSLSAVLPFFFTQRTFKYNLNNLYNPKVINFSSAAQQSFLKTFFVTFRSSFFFSARTFTNSFFVSQTSAFFFNKFFSKIPWKFYKRFSLRVLNFRYFSLKNKLCPPRRIWQRSFFKIFCYREVPGFFSNGLFFNSFFYKMLKNQNFFNILFFFNKFNNILVGCYNKSIFYNCFFLALHFFVKILLFYKKTKLFFSSAKTNFVFLNELNKILQSKNFVFYFFFNSKKFPFINFILESPLFLNFKNKSKKLLIFEKSFIADFFFFNRSIFFFDFFKNFLPVSDTFFFKFYSINKKLFKTKQKIYQNSKRNFSKIKLNFDMLVFKFNLFIFKSKGFFFFLRKNEVLLFLDDFFIWFFCFQRRRIKKRSILGWSRVFFLQPFFFDKTSLNKLNFLQLLQQMPRCSMISRSFNFLYNKIFIKQMGTSLSFYLFNKNLLLFLDNFFWYAFSFKQIKCLIKILMQKPVSKKYFYKNQNFFASLIFQRERVNFFFPIPSFIHKISFKSSIEKWQENKGYFLNYKKFYFFSGKSNKLSKKLVEKFNFLNFFFKRLVFLGRFFNDAFKGLRVALPIKVLFHRRPLILKKLIKDSSLIATFFEDNEIEYACDKASFFIAKYFYLKKNIDLKSFSVPVYDFFLRFFYNHKIKLKHNNLVFLRYFNNILQTINLQVQRDFFFSFIRFFWRSGRKYWFLKIHNNFYFWNSLKKSWFLYKKFSSINFFFPFRKFSFFNDVFLSRPHFKVFNSSIFNQFFSFSIIKRWTCLKFLYRMHDFLTHLRVQRDFISRGLTLNYKKIKLANNFFGTAFFLNNRSFYSFNVFLLKSFLYNGKSIFFFNIQNVFIFDVLLKILRSKLFFSIYFFLPIFSKSVFSLIKNLKNISKTLFFFGSFSFFVRSSVNGFFWNYFSFINPFRKLKKYSFFFKSSFYQSHFCNLLFLDYRSRSFFSKFYSSRLHAVFKFYR